MLKILDISLQNILDEIREDNLFSAGKRARLGELANAFRGSQSAYSAVRGFISSVLLYLRAELASPHTRTAPVSLSAVSVSPASKA
jgi:hypothetical protein